MEELLKQVPQTFGSYGQASRFLGRDTRTVRRYENVLFFIDRSLPNPRIKAQRCRVCEAEFAAHQNRDGFCPGCSQAGLGRKSQGEIIAKRYRGAGNPTS